MMEGILIMEACYICPRNCGVDRSRSVGFCGAGNLSVVSKKMMHMWEEPCISGTKGSGTVFFAGCNLRCVYCQNHKISSQVVGEIVNDERLAEIFIELEQQGAHNINLVNPTHFAKNIIRAIDIAREKGLKIPFVYNTNAYENIKTLKEMSGRIDVYLPDIKYISGEFSTKYSSSSDYFQFASKAVIEMYNQVGTPQFNNEGLIEKGLIIRHLILPSLSKESLKVLDWINENLPKSIFVSLMSQYIPLFKASDYKEINRKITTFEYNRVIDHFYKIGLTNGYMQEKDSAVTDYIPDF